VDPDDSGSRNDNRRLKAARGGREYASGPTTRVEEAPHLKEPAKMDRKQRYWWWRLERESDESRLGCSAKVYWRIRHLRPDPSVFTSCFDAKSFYTKNAGIVFGKMTFA
jgi:hypothetical protein